MTTSMPSTPPRHAPDGGKPSASDSRAGALVAGALVTALALQAGISAADDTEVYFGRPSADADTKPNVLFVLDTSGSMGTVGKDGITRLDSMKAAVKDMLRQANDLNVGLMKFNSFYGGGPILFPVTDIEKELCEGAACSGVVTSAAIGSDADDVEEYVNDGNDVLVNGSVLEIMKTNRGMQNIGLRFAGLEVPRGATIVDARLDLMAERNNAGGEVTVDIRTENSGDSPPFSGADEGISGRPWHVSKTSWKIDEDWEKGKTYTSDNLAGIISQVTSRADWCGGNALALRLEHSAGTTASALRHALTFRSATATDKDGDAVGQPATLRVTYKLDALPSTGGCMRTSISSQVDHSADDAEQYLYNNRMLVNGKVLDMPFESSRAQEIGVRFPDIRIPKKATVRRAWMELHVNNKVNGSKAANVSVKISGQSTDDAARFGGSRNDIGARGETGASVVWSNLPNAASNSTVETEDVTSIVQEIVNRNGWETGNAMAFLFTHSSGTGMRRFTTYNKNRANAPRLIVEYDDETAALDGLAGTRTVKVRDELISLVDSFVASGGTPIVDSLWEASQYYRGGSVEFGKQRGSQNQNYNRVSHPSSYTGGDHYIPNRCTADNLNSWNCWNEQITGEATYVSPITNSCQTNHIVLLSDGEAVTNSSQAAIKGLTGLDSCADGGDEACGKELVQWLYESDLSSEQANRQNVKTHTIAFNLNDPDFLESLAKKGGGNLYEAENSASLLSAFRRILDNVNSIETSFTAPGATVNQFNRLAHRDDIYFAMFKPTDVPRWSGNLKKFRIGSKKDKSGGAESDGEVVIRDRNDVVAVDADTGFFSEQAFSFWEEKDQDGATVTTPDGHDVKRGGAANQMALSGLQRIGARRTYTWTGDATAVPTAGVDLTASEQRLHEDNQLIKESMLGIDENSGDAATRASRREDVLAWIRGVDVQDEDDDDVTDEPRRHMGDPMHSRPVILNYADETATDKVRSIVFVATNEGYLHAIDTSNGEEQFAYMPKELLGQLLPQFDNQTSTDHLYGLDGHLSLWRNDVNGNYVVDSGDEALLFVGMRRGGGRYYALDVSDLDKPRLVWAIEAGSTGFEQLGQTWSRLAPVRIRIDGKDEDVLLFGGGYDEAQDDGQVATDNGTVTTTSVPQLGRGIYIVRARDGVLLWSGLGAAGGSQSFADMKYPIPGNLRAVDITGDGLVNQIYAADTGGQVWRFDLKQGHTAASGNLMQGGVIADLSGSDTADKRRFYAEPDVALIEKGGESFLTVSIGSGWRAHPLDEKVDDRFYVIRQHDVTTVPGTDKYGIEDSDSGEYRPITDTDLTAVTDDLDPEIGPNGWYLDLERSGEKVLGTSVTFDNSVIFSSYVPQAAANDCSAGLGGGRAYVLDLVTGAPRQDFDGDGKRELEDRSTALKHEGLPPDAMIMLTEDGDEHGVKVKPTVLLGVEQFDAGLSADGRRTFWSDRGEGDPIVDPDAAPIVSASGEEESGD